MRGLLLTAVLAALFGAGPALACSYTQAPDEVGNGSAQFFAYRMVAAAAHVDLVLLEDDGTRRIGEEANPQGTLPKSPQALVIGDRNDREPQTVASTLSAAATARGTGWTAYPRARDVELPTAEPSGRQALFRGVLELKGRCLRLSAGEESSLLIWPKGTLVYHKGEGGLTVAMPSGQEFKLGDTLETGGAALNRSQLGPRPPSNLPARSVCPDPMIWTNDPVKMVP